MMQVNKIPYIRIIKSLNDLISTTKYLDFSAKYWDEYRYGYNGMEKDNEVKGQGNSINYKYRMHDPSIGRFFVEDPLAPKYTYNSPYAFSENRVIDGVELEVHSKGLLLES